MSIPHLVLVDGVVTEVTPEVAKEFEFLRSECERLNRELAAMTAVADAHIAATVGWMQRCESAIAAKDKALDVLKALAESQRYNQENVEGSTTMCCDAHDELITELEKVK